MTFTPAGCDMHATDVQQPATMSQQTHILIHHSLIIELDFNAQ